MLLYPYCNYIFCMRILLVEDEKKIALSLKKGLELESYAVDVEFDGESGYEMAISEDYDVVILDRMLPEIDGVEICKRLRKEKSQTPILMLTAKGQVHDRVEGLDAGADDYLVKPFAFEELLARVRALIRRPKVVESTKLQVADLVLDPAAHSVMRGEKLIKLSKREFALLEYLMRNAGSIVTKDQIIAHVWNFDADVLPNTVEVYVGYLRSKIDKPRSDNDVLIHTVRGFGYKIGVEEE